MPNFGVSRTAHLIGLAGLLPQAVAVILIVTGRGAFGFWAGVLLALAYGAIILSFVGGVWWGFAMRRDAGQAALAAISVIPSLVALALVIAAAATGLAHLALIALGVAIALTLLVDRYLVATGEAPAGWMRLRIPLSLGLGLITILAGVLAA